VVPVLIAAIGFGLVSLLASDEPTISGTTVALPTSSWKPGQASDGALITGILRMDDVHCVYLESGTDQTYVVWPAGWRATREGDALTLYDGDLTVVAHDGDSISTGGGFQPAQAFLGEPCLPVSGEVGAVQGEVAVVQ
jgi:hypothetical protein